MFKQSIILGFCFLALACGSKSSDTKGGDAPRKVEAPTPPSSQKTEKDVLAKESFLKTFAAGKKKFTHKNVKLEYKKTELYSGKVKEEWSGNCTSRYALTLEGRYPTVNFAFGSIDCNREKFYSLDHLESIVMNMSYALTHIPQETIPNQFRLSLQGIGGSRPWKSYLSQNGVTREDVIVLDFLGDEEELIGTKSTHYVFLQIRRDSSEKNILTIDYRNDDFGRRETNNIKISAELE